MKRFAVTFGVQYNRESHPSGLPITGRTYVILEGERELDARLQANHLFGRAWAFIYTMDVMFKEDIRRFDLVELILEK